MLFETTIAPARDGNVQNGLIDAVIDKKETNDPLTTPFLDVFFPGAALESAAALRFVMVLRTDPLVNTTY